MAAARRESEWVPTTEAVRLAGFVNRQTWIKVIRARHIQPRMGRRNQKVYSRAQMLELARERAAAEERRARANGRKGDPLSDPKTTGEIEAEVFKLFAARTPPVDVVVQLKLSSDLVDHLFEKWWKMNQRGQAWLNPAPPPVQETAPPPPVPVERFELSVLPVSIAMPAAEPRPRSETHEVIAKARSVQESVRQMQETLKKANEGT